MYRLSRALTINALLNSHLWIRMCSISIAKFKTLLKRPNKISKATKGVFLDRLKHLKMLIDSCVKRMQLNLSTKQIDCFVYEPKQLNMFECALINFYRALKLLLFIIFNGLIFFSFSSLDHWFLKEVYRLYFTCGRNQLSWNLCNYQINYFNDKQNRLSLRIQLMVRGCSKNHRLVAGV